MAVAHFVQNKPQNTFYDMDLQSLKMPVSNQILLRFSAHIWVPVFEIWINFFTLWNFVEFLYTLLINLIALKIIS